VVAAGSRDPLTLSAYLPNPPLLTRLCSLNDGRCACSPGTTSSGRCACSPGTTSSSHLIPSNVIPSTSTSGSDGFVLLLFVAMKLNKVINLCLFLNSIAIPFRFQYQFILSLLLCGVSKLMNVRSVMTADF